MTEYSGFKYAIFFLAEYFGMFAISGLAVTLFLGGWHAPISVLQVVPSYLWFFLKLGVLLFVFIWIRGTLPRIRVDQMMNFAWKFMTTRSRSLGPPVSGFWRVIKHSGKFEFRYPGDRRLTE